ncbi:MAG: error-prone DNA polymerase [bacterium]
MFSSHNAIYAELHCHSGFSLLDGASTPERLVARAWELGYAALALTDHDDLGGLVRLLEAGREQELHTIPGAELTFEGEHHLTVLAESAQGWANLSSLVSHARMRTARDPVNDRGVPRIRIAELLARPEGLIVLSGCPRGRIPTLLRQVDPAGARAFAGPLRDAFGDRFVVEVMDHDTAEESDLVEPLIALARRLGTPWVLTNNAHYADRLGREVHDVLTCLRHQVALDVAGTRLRPNDSWGLADPTRLAERWRHHPEGLRQSLELAERCRFQLSELAPRLPAFPLPLGADADTFLSALVQEGLRDRYPCPEPRHHRQLEHELGIIRRLGLAGYFLIVWDIVRFCRRHGILCQGRGSAANSAVCYVLGITAVDPVGMDLLFERFLSESRGEPPDIDLDIAHRDREEVLQYVYERYGRDHAAMVCEAITYRARSAVRDAARVLGFSPEQGDDLAAHVDRHREASGAAEELAAGAAQAAGFDPSDTRVQALIRVVHGLSELPRHRSIHVGGFVITENPLHEVVPIEPASMPNRTIISWDKDDIPPTGLVKFDLLGLGMLTLLQDAQHLIRRTCGDTVDLAHLPMDDPQVYDLLCAADTVGVFQVESRAQMNTLPRLRPRKFYDLVVEVALIRPGPIQGDMVHPYLRRRRGEEPIEYLHPSLEPVLKRTLGVPLFQEQGMKCAVACAGFTPEQADELRRAMGFKRSDARMGRIGAELVAGMRRNGLDEDTIARIVKQLTAFSSYGFPESHSASFALIVYASVYVKLYYAPEFLACLLNAQPMGFYSPGTLVHDARRRGVEVRAPDLGHSRWMASIEPSDRPFGTPQEGTVADIRGPRRAVRLGLRLVQGLGPVARERLELALSDGPFRSMADVAGRSGLGLPELRTLAKAGAFGSFCPDRRQALWEVLRLAHNRGAPLAPVPADPHRAPGPSLDTAEEILHDYAATGASTLGHPMEHLRAEMDRRRVIRSDLLRRHRNGGRVRVGGVVICRQRPGTAKGFFFVTLEDEAGMVNVIVRPQRFEKNAQLLRTAPVLLVEGRLQHEQSVLNVIGDRFSSVAPRAGADHVRSHDFH